MNNIADKLVQVNTVTRNGSCKELTLSAIHSALTRGYKQDWEGNMPSR